jgi:circularin A/uberolysin family circular bacteriocin
VKLNYRIISEKKECIILQSISYSFNHFIIIFLILTTPELANTLGESSYAARRAIDIIAATGNVIAIVGLIGAVTGAIGVDILFTVKRLVRTFGKNTLQLGKIYS